MTEAPPASFLPQQTLGYVEKQLEQMQWYSGLICPDFPLADNWFGLAVHSFLQDKRMYSPVEHSYGRSGSGQCCHVVKPLDMAESGTFLSAGRSSPLSLLHSLFHLHCCR